MAAARFSTTRPFSSRGNCPIPLIYHPGAAFTIELLHLVLPAFTHIDGVWVNQLGSALKIDFCDGPILIIQIQNDKIFFGDVAQADRVGRIGFFAPMPRFARPGHHPLIIEEIKDFSPFLGAESFTLLEGKFKSGTLDVADQNLQIVRMNESVFG